VERYQRRVTGVALAVVHNQEDALELAQETFIRAYENIAGFESRSSFSTWLYRIAANGCRDFLRSGGRSERPCDISGEELWTFRDPERDAVARQSLAALAEALAGLPPASRNAFVLFYLENRSYEEISEATGVAVNALKVRVHRARELLRRRLGRVLETSGEVVR
jgi:RNA polymerase sigma-70 factor (ECF subfamily)